MSSLKLACTSLVTGPGIPFPIFIPSIDTTGVMSLEVEVRNTSSNSNKLSDIKALSSITLSLEITC